jgi:hypothetical protein
MPTRISDPRGCETVLKPSGCDSAGRNGGIFARPNFKAFVFGAILILLVQGLVPNGPFAATKVPASLVANQTMTLGQLLRQAHERPSCEVFTLISQHYERKGEYRRAMRYLRLADEADSLTDL